MVADGSTAVATTQATNPYIGLSYYTEADAEWFFGRDEECQTIIGNLRAARLTILYSPSGVGKSSLLRAGVAHQLRELAEHQLARRGCARYVPIVFNAWKDDPVEDLIAAMECAVRPLLPADVPVELPRASLAAAIAAAAETSGAEPLIILDQFEEYFLYRSEEATERRFVDELAACVGRPELRANFLIAIREDAYAGLGDLFAGRIANVYGNYLELEYLDRDAAREAIVKPIEHFNELHPDADPIKIEPELVEKVLAEVTAEDPLADQPGASDEERNGAAGRRDQIETPYLQLVMSKLWTHERGRGSAVLTLATLHELGGAREIIRTHLDGALEALAPDEYDTALEIFHYLVTPSGAKIVYAASDLAAQVEQPYERVSGVLTELADEDRRILRRVPPPAGKAQPADRFEIFHDVLAAPIIDWRKRVLEHRRRAKEARERERLEGEKREAEARTRTEEHRRRAFQRLAVIALILLVLAVGLGVFALVEQKHAVSNLHAAQSSQLVASAAQTLSSNPQLSALLALRALHLKYTPQAEEALRAAVPAMQELKALPVGSPVNSAVFSRDASKALTAGEDGTARVWDVSSGRLLRELDGGHRSVNNAAFSPDGSMVVTATQNGEARLWDTATGRGLGVLAGHSGPVNTAAFSPNGAAVVTATKGGVATIWDVRTQQPLVPALKDGGVASVEGAAFSPDGKSVVTASETGNATIWDAATGTSVATLHSPDQFGGLDGAAFSNNGTRLVTAGADGTARIWNVGTRSQLVKLSVAQGAVISAAFSHGDSEVVTADQNGTAAIWDANSGRQLTVLSGHEGPVRTAAFSGDDRQAITASADGTARIWDASPRERLATLRGGAGSVIGATFSPSGAAVVTANQDGTARIWGASGNRQPILLRGHQGPVYSAQFSPDGRYVLTAGTDGTARVWNAPAGTPWKTLRAHGGVVNGAAYNPAGSEIVTANHDASADIWGAQSGAQLLTLRSGSHTGSVEGAAFSHDSKRVATANEDGSATIWDAASGKALRTLTVSEAPELDVAFTKDGTKLLVAGKDGVAHIFDTATGRSLMTFSDHAGPLYTASFSPDEREVVTGGEAGRVSIWDARTGKRLTVFDSHEGVVFSAAYSPNGSEIVTGSQNGTAAIWSTELSVGVGSLERVAEARVTHQLTAQERKTYVAQ
jgi:WD40 repeat protein